MVNLAKVGFKRFVQRFQDATSCAVFGDELHITKIKIDEALIRNTCFLRHGLEIGNALRQGSQFLQKGF